jgi:uncharacterized membrane protein
MALAPKWMREVGWRTVLGAVLLGGIIHIGAILAVPLAYGNAYDRLRGTLPANSMVVLPPPAPGKLPLPFMMPDALYAMCRYDVSGGPVVVTAALADTGWALSLHTPQGDNFYVMPAQPQRRNEVSVIVVPGGERITDVTSLTSRQGRRDTQISAPTEQGVAVIRAPLKGEAWRAQTEGLLRRASCAPIKQ